MSKNKHTPEPWIAGDAEDSDYFLVGPHDGDGIVYQPVVTLHSEANARRIVACVNACAGIGTEYLEHFGGTTFNNFKRVEEQRDELLAALESTVETIEWMRGCTLPADDEIEKAINEGNTVIARVKGIKLTDNE